MIYAALFIDKLLLVLSAVMLLRAVLPGTVLNRLTTPLQEAARFVIPLGFHERLISVLAALWLWGLAVAFRVGGVLWW